MDFLNQEQKDNSSKEKTDIKMDIQDNEQKQNQGKEKMDIAMEIDNDSLKAISEKEKMDISFNISETYAKDILDDEINVVILPRNATPMKIKSLKTTPMKIKTTSPNDKHISNLKQLSNLKKETAMEIEKPSDQDKLISEVQKQTTFHISENLQNKMQDNDIDVVILPKNAPPMKMEMNKTIPQQMETTNPMQFEQENNQNLINLNNQNVQQRSNLKKETKMEIEKDSEQDQFFTEVLKPKKQKKYTIYKNYTVTLNQTDVTYGIKGHNKFYRIFLLQKVNMFYVKTEHGRVGANPQVRLYNQSNLQEAIKFFKKKFHDKTKNHWDNRNQFRQVVDKYTYLPMKQGAYQQAGTINQEIKAINQRNKLLIQQIENIESHLPISIKNLMKFIWNVEKMNKTMKDLNFDTSKNPLGKISMSQIQRGYQILTQLQSAILQEGRGRKRKVITLTNQFYTYIPQDFGMRLPPVIDSVKMLREKTHLLEVLTELHSTDNLINQLVTFDIIIEWIFQMIKKEKENSQTYWRLLFIITDKVIARTNFIEQTYFEQKKSQSEKEDIEHIEKCFQIVTEEQKEMFLLIFKNIASFLNGDEENQEKELVTIFSRFKQLRKYKNAYGKFMSEVEGQFENINNEEGTKILNALKTLRCQK